MKEIGLIRIHGLLHEVELPFSLGNSTRNAIYVQGESAAAVYAYAYNVDGLLRAFQADGEEMDLPSLKAYGIQLLACYKAGDSRLQRILARERQLQIRLPRLVAAVSLYALPQGLRAIGFVLLLATLALGAQKEAEDLGPSHPTSVGGAKLEVLREGITHPGVFSTKHRSGVVFTLKADDDETAKPAKVSFHVGGLAAHGSVEVLVNGELLYRSPILEDCIDSACPQELIIPPGYIKSGDNRLAIRHTPAAEKWILYDVKYESYRPMTLVEERRFNLYMEEAAELFEKRDLSPYNLISAGRILRKISRFTVSLYLTPVQRTAFATLDGEVKGHITKFLNDFWFNNEKKVVAGDLKAAQDELMELTRYFPDAASVQGGRIEAQLERIHTLMGER